MLVSRRQIWSLLILVLLAMITYGAKRLKLHHLIKGHSELSSVAQRQFSPIGFEEGFSYIAHAGGAYDSLTYTNCREAIDLSYSSGARLIELDFNYSSDSVVVLAHDEVKRSATEYMADSGKCHHLTLDSLLTWLTNKDVFIVTDIKTDNVAILGLIARKAPELRSKFIPQTTTIAEIPNIYELGYQRVIFTNYRAAYPNAILKELARRRIVSAITVPDDVNLTVLTTFVTLADLPTPFLVHTINDVADADAFRQAGLRGVYTDYLHYGDYSRIR